MSRSILIILMVFILTTTTFSQDIIVKYNNKPLGFKDSVEELGLYLFEKGTQPKGYLYYENNNEFIIQGIKDPLKTEQQYLIDLNIDDLVSKNKVNVSILDSGINFSHEDIIGTGDNDVNGHGTALAGIIGALKNNGKGISGISECNIISKRISDQYGHSKCFDIIKKIVESVKENSKIILIASGNSEYSKALKEAVDYSDMNNSIIIAAGGNTNSEKVLYPAAFENVISVGSINENKEPCNYNDWGYNNGNPLGSCYGRSVDLMIPGKNIYSTDIAGNYSYFNGTSYSSAIVTGISAYLAGNDLNITREELKAKILNIIKLDIVPIPRPGPGPGPRPGLEPRPVPGPNPNYYSSSIEKYTSTYNSSSEQSPTGLVLVSRTLSKNNVLPDEQVDITLTLENKGSSSLTEYKFIEPVSTKLLMSDTVEISLGSVTKTMILSSTEDFSQSGTTIEVNYSVSKTKKGAKPYTFLASEFPAGKTITIKYKVKTSKRGIYQFADYEWTGKYGIIEYFDKEINGNYLIVELPILVENCSPAGEIVNMNPTFSWPDAGAGFSYEFYLYMSKGGLKKIYFNKELSVNSISLTATGITLEPARTYIWKVRGVYNGQKTGYSTVKFVPYNLDTPYPESPTGIYWSSDFPINPEFKWLKISEASRYKIILYKGKKKLAESYTSGNVNSIKWSQVAGTFEPNTLYKWSIMAIGSSDNIFSNTVTSEFSYSSIGETILTEPLGVISSPSSNIFEFKWQAVNGATSYDLNIYMGKRKVVKTNVGGTSYSYTVKPLKSYKWEVIPKVGMNLGVKAIGLFTTDPGLPPEFIVPAGDTVSTAPIVEWTSGYDRVGLQIKLGTKKIVDTFIGTGEVTYNLSDNGISLLPSKTYSFAIRGETANGTLYTKWLKKKVKIFLSKTAFISPLKTTTSLTPTFEWDPIDEAQSYKLTIKLGKTVILEKAGITTTSYIYNSSDASGVSLIDGKTYTATICGVNSGTDGAKSKTLKFKVYAIASPTITYPEKTSLLKTLLSWNAVSGATGYEWKLKLGTKTISGPNLTTETSYNFGDGTDELLVNGKTYSLEVSAKTTVNSVEYYSKVAKHKFKAYQFGTPQIISPGTVDKKNPEIITTLSPTFSWTQVSNYDYYELLIKGKKTIKVYTNSYTLTEPQALKDGKAYDFKVRVKGNYGVSNWSARSYFKVFKRERPELSYPGTTIKVTRPTFVFKIPNETIRADITVYKLKYKKGVWKKVKYKKFKSPKNSDNAAIIYRCPKPFTMDQKYTWNVKAVGLNGKASYSEYMDFEVSNMAADRHETMEEIFSIVRNLSESNLTTTSFTLNWDAMSGALKYIVYLDGVKYGESTTTSLNISGLSANTTYEMRVAHVLDSGEAAKSTAYNVTTLPLPPEGLIATEKTFTDFKLSWDAVTNVKKYHIYKDGVEYGTSTINSMIISDLESNTSYSMKVSIENNSGESDKSSELAVVTPVGPPEGVLVENITESGFDISWTALNNVVKYYLYINGIKHSTITGETATITGLSASMDYAITVSAEGVTGEGPKSDVIQITTAPPTPTSLTVTEITVGGFKITWDSIQNTSYNIYIDGVKEHEGVVGSSFYITGLQPNTSYSMQLSAQNSSAVSSLCSAVNGLTVPGPVTGLTGSSITTSSFTLGWTDMGNVTYYIYKNGTQIGTSTTNSFSVTGLDPSKIYSMQVAAENSSGKGYRSSEYDITTVPIEPKGLDASFTVDLSSSVPSSYKLSWTAIDNVTKYHIYRKVESGTYSELGTSTTTQFTVSELNSNTQYFFKVSAENITAEGTTTPELYVYMHGFDVDNDFSDITKWSYNWVINSGHLKIGGGSGERRCYFNKTVNAGNDYEIITRAKITTGNGYGVYYRYDGNSAPTAYCNQFDPGLNPDKIVIRKVINGHEQSPLINKDFPAGFNIYNSYHILKIKIQGNHHQLFLDGTNASDFSDVTDPFETGGVGFRRWSSTNLQLDYIIVKSILTY